MLSVFLLLLPQRSHMAGVDVVDVVVDDECCCRRRRSTATWRPAAGTRLRSTRVTPPQRLDKRAEERMGTVLFTGEQDARATKLWNRREEKKSERASYAMPDDQKKKKGNRSSLIPVSLSNASLGRRRLLYLDLPASRYSLTASNRALVRGKAGARERTKQERAEKAAPSKRASLPPPLLDLSSGSETKGKKKMSSCPLASPDRPPIEAVLFDLDDTLYRIETIPERVRENIEGEFFILFFSRRPLLVRRGRVSLLPFLLLSHLLSSLSCLFVSLLPQLS